MKKLLAAFGLIFIALNGTFNYAQARRQVPSENGKANRRETKPVDAPTPAPTPVAEEAAPPPDDQTAVDDGETIRVDTELVTVPVKVLDRNNRLIGGLTKESFQIYEDNAPQEIAYFSNEDQPFTVALVLDMSYSATFKIAEIQNAATAFIAQLRENDKVMVVSFDQDIHLLCEPTSDRKMLTAAIKRTNIASGTSLYDAVDLVINERFRKMAGRKAVVLFTDGVDTTSRRSHDLKNLSDALESDALIYPIQYDTFADVQAMKDKPIILSPPKSGNPFPVPSVLTGTPGGPGTTQEDYRKAGEYLDAMATRTGGRIHKAATTSNLALAFSRIAAELREFYSLGYYPQTQSKAGKRRKIKVRVNQPNVVVRARDEYVVGKKK